MAEYVNQWESYKELSIENDRDPPGSAGSMPDRMSS